MPARSLIPRLTDIVEAIERVREVVGDMTRDVRLIATLVILYQPPEVLAYAHQVFDEGR